MTTEQTRYHDAVQLIERINQFLAGSNPNQFLEQVLDLVIEITGSRAATLFLYDPPTSDMILHSVRGSPASEPLLGKHLPSNIGPGWMALKQGTPLFIPNIANHPAWDTSFGEWTDLPLCSVCCLPLKLMEQPVGVIQVCNPSALLQGDPDHQELLHLLCTFLSPHVEQAHRLFAAQERERRLKELIVIMSCIATTLERDRLLDDIMTYTQELLEVEATSIWIKDEKSGDLILHIATGERSDHIREVRVPADHGIIGNVVSTGQPLVVNDVTKDDHFYGKIDQWSGFKTRAIMCVPLRAPRIQLGGTRGELQETIIGGAQALNKRDGRPFTDEDAVLFEMLANQSATILQLSELYDQLARLYNELMLSYNEARKMFRGFINGITSFIDRKDPYTRGHSQRVADFAVAIAQQLRLSDEMVHHIRLGSILHDVGKIGVPDEVLKKPSQLTDEEMEKMKLHPTYGIELLRDSDLLRLLPRERQAIEEHHERLDGSGYPRGLKGARHGDDQDTETVQGISLIGRIVAVADAFDAMTSDRPYRVAMPIEKAFAILRSASGTEFDPECVESLIRARERGHIQTQHERPEHQDHLGQGLAIRDSGMGAFQGDTDVATEDEVAAVAG